MEKPGLHFEDPHIKERADIDLKPTERFLDAEIPCEYSYTFPGGEKLEVRQSNRGMGFVAIKKDGKILFDVNKLLPDGWKFVTPTYFKKHPKEVDLFDYLDDDWRADPERKMILLGEFKGPQDFFTLLHEVGHSVNANIEEIRKIKSMTGEILDTKDVVYKVLLSEEEAKLASRIERNAWAWATHALRKIERATGIDLKFLFATFDDFKKYIDKALATYRRGYEWIIKGGHDKEFYKELQRLFDRWQYGKEA